jgi:hypothetical protein
MFHGPRAHIHAHIYIKRKSTNQSNNVQSSAPVWMEITKILTGEIKSLNYVNLIALYLNFKTTKTKSLPVFVNMYQ